MSAEDRLRDEISKCRRCEACKDLLYLSCLVFPEMFRLVDAAWKTGDPLSTDQLRYVAGLCNFCAACPCPAIRTAIMDLKTEVADTCGLPFSLRALEHMDRMGRLAGAVPRFSNFLLRHPTARALLSGIMGIHRDRKFPPVPSETFPKWFRRRKAPTHSPAKDRKKVAYFSGCTANYFFPEVAKAVVEVLERNGIYVCHPKQTCCGMPALLEGDRALTLKFARFNVSHLAKAVEEGYDILCSCPTCGYMLKKIMRVGADQARWRRDSEEIESDFVHVDIGQGLIAAISGMRSVRVPTGHLKALLKDQGYFSAISPEKRILISDHTYDVGEYLKNLHEAGGFDARLGSVPDRGAYYPPCHLREQKIGSPYQDLMGLIPGLSMASIQGDYCCGNGGIMGLKQAFHHSSIKIASRLIGRIKDINPEVITTDCLSCRMQFNQLTPYRVVHPIEIIKESYVNYDACVEKRAA
ncbi:MAG: FeS-binding protein [Deltaproteobacteria bacterium]|nr:FeS-binding protein [Deltaproteobacteria bacterium]